MRELIVDALERDGCGVTQAADGHELSSHVAVFFRALWRGPMPDLIIADVRMPGPGGLEVLAALRRARRAPPVILITAFADDELRKKAFRLGAAAIFDKPFDLDQLCAAVRSLTHSNL